MGWTGGYVLLALLLAPYLRKFGKYTVPDFVGDRYYSRTARIVAVVCAIFVSFTYVAGQMRGVGIVFSRFLEVDIVYGVLIGMGLVFFYAVLGGMKGITYTQVAQYCVLIFAYLVPAIFISLVVSGSVFPQVGFGAADAQSGEYLLDRLDDLHAELGFSPYTDGSKGGFDIFAITAALMVGTAGLPHVLIRFFTVPRVRDARASAGWALVFIAILYTTAPAVAVFARSNLLDTVSGRAYADVPEWFATWEETGLISYEDLNGDGLIQYVGAGSAHSNELTIDRDIMVLARARRGGRPGGRALDGRGAAARRLVGGQPRPAQAVVPAQYHGAGRADRGSRERGGGSGRGGLPGYRSARLRRRGRGLRLRSGRLLVLPGPRPRHLLEADEPGGSHRGHDQRHGLHGLLHRLLQVREPGRQHARQLALRRVTRGHRNDRDGVELPRLDRRLVDDGSPAEFRAATGRGDPNSERRGAGPRDPRVNRLVRLPAARGRPRI
jgi:hypothetical protein